AGEVGARLDVRRVRALAEREHHLVGRRDERVADDLERDRVDRQGRHPYTSRATSGETLPSATSPATRSASRSAGSPKPPPPAVRWTYTSPAPIVVENIGGSTSSLPSGWISRFDEVVPGWPPRSPYGGWAA